MKEVALVIGRFQPLHQEHINLIEFAATKAKRVLVFVGSVNEARSLRNPWTYVERLDLLEAAFPDASRFSFMPLHDYRYDNELWKQGLLLELVDHEWTDYLEYNQICLVGHKKDDSTFYLDMFPEFEFVPYESTSKLNATDIRNLWYGGFGFDELLQLGCNRHTAKWLWGETVEDYFGVLADEREEVNKYIKSWASSPFPPVFVAVDAIIRHDDSKVVLIRRKSEFGNGLLAMPGGYIDTKETLLQSCLREVREETGILEDQLLLRGTPWVVDAPNRSMRGRMITHVHMFDVCKPIHPVAGDDAGEVVLMPYTEINKHKHEFFSDHWHILNKALNLGSVYGA